MDKYEIVLSYIAPYKALLQLVQDLQNELEVLEYNHAGVKAVRYDKEMSTNHNEALLLYKKLEDIDAIEVLQNKIFEKQKQIINIENVLGQLSDEIKMVVLGVYCAYPKKRTFEYYSRRLNKSVNAIRYNVIKELKLVRIP